MATASTMLRSTAARTLLRRRCYPPHLSTNAAGAVATESSAADSIKVGGAANNDAHRQPQRRSYGAFAWGTSKKGTVPLTEILDAATNAPPPSSGAAGQASSMMDRGTAFDHPREIDTKAAFGMDAGVEKLGATVEKVVCGPTNSAAIMNDGSLLTWGENGYGQLGHGHTNPILRPTKVVHPPDSALNETGVKTIAFGPTHSALIDNNGDVYTMGHGGSALNGMGMLCHGSENSFTTPTLVQSLVEDGVFASQIACGELHTTVLTTQGETLTSGGGSYGRLGNLDTTDQVYLEPVEMLEGVEITEISGGHAFTLALDGKEGVVYSWGRNDKGQLGLGAGLSVDIYAMEDMPSPIESQLEGRRVKKIAAGHSHAAAVTSDGELFMWGSGVFLEPQAFPSLLHSKIVDVACGQDYTVALSDDGRLYSFGRGKTGVLGLASVKKANQPTLVEGLASRTVVQMSAGHVHFACLVEDVEEEQVKEEVEGGEADKKE